MGTNDIARSRLEPVLSSLPFCHELVSFWHFQLLIFIRGDVLILIVSLGEKDLHILHIRLNAAIEKVQHEDAMVKAEAALL